MPSLKLARLMLTAAECGALEALVRKRTALQSLAQRVRIVLACTEDSGTVHVLDPYEDSPYTGDYAHALRNQRILSS